MAATLGQRSFDDLTPEEQEDRAQAVLFCLARGPKTAAQIADALFLPYSAMRVTLERLSTRHRVVCARRIGDPIPLWYGAEAPDR